MHYLPLKYHRKATLATVVHHLSNVKTLHYGHQVRVISVSQVQRYIRAMELIKTEPVDFVKEFQEYLTQPTQHVNMISVSICGEKVSSEPFPAGLKRAQ